VSRFAFVALLASFLALIGIGGASALSPNGPSTNIVISQVYGAGGNSGALFNADFIELFNLGSAPQSVAGWSVQYTSATGTGAIGGSGNGSASQLQALPNTTIPAGGYLLVSGPAGTTGASESPDVTSSLSLAAGAGKVALVTGTTPLGCNSASTCSDAQLQRVVDFVGYGTGSSGANFFEGTGPAPTPSNTLSDVRANHGCTDTDNNAVDFTTATPAPRNSSATPNPCGGGGPTAPSVNGAASPSSADGGASTLLTARVTPGANPTSTGLAVSSDLSSIGGSTTQAFFDDGTHGDATAGDGTFSFSATVASGTSAGSKSLPLAVTDVQGRSGSGSIALTVTTPPVSLAIHDIQGAAFISPYKGQIVRTTGIVTALDSNGYYLQDPNPDTNDATSEGIFVFTSSAPHAAVGDAVSVRATVAEFLPGGTASNLTVTELDSPTTTLVSSGNPLPPPAVIGTAAGDRTPPPTLIDGEATGDANTQASFDPAHDGLDFWESLEGMRVEIDDAVAVGPTNSFGETEVVSASTVPSADRTPRGGVVVKADSSNPDGGDYNPERVVVDDGLENLPVANVGDSYSTLVGPLTYDFGDYYLEPNQPATLTSGGITRGTTTAQGAGQLAVATFNVENLAPTDPQSKFDALAQIVLNNLKSPDIIAVEEVQDNDGATDDGVVAADQTIADLTAAIHAAGGPDYSSAEIDPQNDQDGGEPGGNIRVVYLYRTDRGLSFVSAPAGDSTTSETLTPSGDLALNPGRIDPTSNAWAASRKPLAGEFMLRGQKLFVIANHWVAKLPDDPLEGHVQPPQQSSVQQREQQAEEVRSFTQGILGTDPNADVVVLGDLNDSQFSQPLQTLDATPLHDLVTTLPVNEQYTYVFEGNSEVLDHILVSDHLFSQVHAGDYDVVHVNSEFADQTSDHDPQVVRLLVQGTPQLTWAAPAQIAFGTPLGAAQLDATSSVPGTFAYSPAAGMVLSPGAHTLHATFTPTDTADWQSASISVPITVGFTSACITGTHTGPLTVAAGESVCIGPGAKLTGPLRVQAGGALWMSGASITGPVQSSHAAAVTLCGDTVDGPVSITGTTGPVVVGNPPDCDGNLISGPLDLTGNPGGVTASGNTVGGPVRSG
jgi:hypothetical protein